MFDLPYVIYAVTYFEPRQQVAYKADGQYFDLVCITAKSGLHSLLVVVLQLCGLVYRGVQGLTHSMISKSWQHETR